MMPLKSIRPGDTRLLRPYPETAGIPVVALSAFAGHEVGQHAVAAGCREFAEKPIEMKELGELVARNVSRGTRARPRA